MTEDKGLTNEEIARVFAMYWSSQFTESPTANITGGGPAGYIPWLVIEAAGAEVNLSTYKLLLTDLKDITDENTAVMAKIQNIYYDKPITREHLRGEWLLQYDVRQYLIMEGFAVPLFFGVNHWANNKTAIELGIAINKNL